MNDKEWLECQDPMALLYYLESNNKLNSKKLLKFASQIFEYEPNEPDNKIKTFFLGSESEKIPSTYGIFYARPEHCNLIRKIFNDSRAAQ